MSEQDSLSEKVADHHTTLYGEHGNLGVAQKTAIMWRVQVWILCTLSALASSVLTAAVLRWIK